MRNERHIGINAMDKTEISTDKIKLKLVNKTDAANIHFLRTNAEVAGFINRDINKTVSEIEEFIEKVTADSNKMLFFKIETKNDNKFVGTICLKNIDLQNKYAEVGYELLPNFQGKGWMSEALRSLIDFAFTNLSIETIEAFTNYQNVRSRKLLESFNFKLIDKIDINNLNNVVYQLINTDK